MEYKDYYKALGLTRAASADEIKKAYRKLARQFHPDKNQAKGAEERFKEINEANEVLSDPEKRKAYDELGANWRAGQQFRPPPGWHGAGARGGPQGGFGGGDFSDFFSSLFGGAGGRGGMGGMGGMGGFEPEAEDSRDVLTVSLEESFHGGSRRVQLGSGRTLEVKIPKGVTEGKTIRLSGQGRFGGDLLLEIRFAPHPRFEVKDRDISCVVAVAPWEAALGASVAVPTLGGEVDLKLPAGTQGGRKLRLKGRGLPAATPGDQTIEIRIVTPPAANEEQRAFYEQMAQQFAGFTPRG
ncbi:MAG: DnaJ C-terminal domain-containing protein [Stagnimonas sp.]|nr:DnaJ C-terminal domain-containing protein [Stagnimonas sp.]